MLMPTPYIHRDPDVNRFADVPAERQSTTVEILYCTDRNQSNGSGPPHRYGSGRSQSLAFGTTRVRIGGASLTWEELVQASRVGRRSGRIGVHHLDATELVRMPATPWYVHLVDDSEITEAAVIERWIEAAQEIQGVINENLRNAGGGDVFLFVHGFNATFGDAAITAAELWHFLGRRGVACSYSWPAGSAGILGYDTDRESSEFTVEHFKQFVRVVAGADAVERIHHVAHSRGSDVVVAAIRELYLQYQAAGFETSAELKIENLVFIAADIDQDVFDQRFGTESVRRAARHVTIYTGARDVALGLSSSKFSSALRVGQLGTAEVTEKGRVVLDHLADQMTIVHQPRRRGLFGHVYHKDDPGVSSDLLLLLLGHQTPGAEHGRPLTKDPSGVWVVPKDNPWD